MKNKTVIPKIAALITGGGFIALGIFRGEVNDILMKAVRICLECIGIG